MSLFTVYVVPRKQAGLDFELVVDAETPNLAQLLVWAMVPWANWREWSVPSYRVMSPSWVS